MTSTAADPLAALTARLVALGGTRHPLRLSLAEAKELERRLRSGETMSAALAKARRTRTFAAVLAHAEPNDAVGVVSRLVPAVGEAEAFSRRLAAAGLYPMLLAFSLFTVASVVLGLTLPRVVNTLGTLPGTGQVAVPLTALALLGGALLGLVSLGVAFLARTSNPLMGRATRSLDEALAYQTALELHRDGVALERALEASTQWLRGASRSAVDALVHQLAAGAAAPRGTIASRLLAAGAQRGVAAPVLEALAAQRRIEAANAVPAAIFRAQWTALFLGGIGVAGVGVALFQVYTGAAAGLGGGP